MQDAISMVLTFALYMLAVPFLGYLVSTLIFLTVSCWLLQFNLRTSMLLAITLSLAMWVVFVKVLKVYFGHAWLI
jgi:Cu/Ag efflux pump CusA